MPSVTVKDVNPRTASSHNRDIQPRIDALTPSPVPGGNLGQTANDGLLPFGVERDEELERAETEQ